MAALPGRVIRVVGMTLNPRWACDEKSCDRYGDWSDPSRVSREAAQLHTKHTGHPTVVSRETLDKYALRPNDTPPIRAH